MIVALHFTGTSSFNILIRTGRTKSGKRDPMLKVTNQRNADFCLFDSCWANFVFYNLPSLYR